MSTVGTENLKITKMMDALMDEKREFSDGSIEGYGLMAALTDMMPHWESHLKDGQSPEVIATDLKALEAKVRELRGVIEDFQGTKKASNFQVSLDGGKTLEPITDDLRIVYKDILVDGEDEEGELSFVFTHEGMITDLWVSRDDHLDHNLGSASEMVEEIQSRLISDK